MNQLKSITIGIYADLLALVIGLIGFALSWNLWDFWGGPMPGIQILLFPGNLTLVHVWHPLFSEEVNFWPKLALHMFGQFLVVACVVTLFFSATRRVFGVRTS